MGVRVGGSGMVNLLPLGISDITIYYIVILSPVLRKWRPAVRNFTILYFPAIFKTR